MQISRESADTLMREWVKSESLRKHMYCVEAAMRAYAGKFGEDDPSRLGFASLAEAEELWGVCGLLHDFDYEKFPGYNETKREGHPFEGVRELEKLGYPREVLTAILGHALYSGTPRLSNMAKVLFAADELCGFLAACAYTRPDKFLSLEYKSVKKKLKDKSFAAKVSRQDIAQGIGELGIPEEEHINFVIQSLRKIQDKIFQG